MALGLMLLASTAGARRVTDLRGWKLTASRHRLHGHRWTNRPKILSLRVRSAIVGGGQISTEQAPWQVALLGEIPVEIEGKNIFWKSFAVV